MCPNDSPMPGEQSSGSNDARQKGNLVIIVYSKTSSYDCHIDNSVTEAVRDSRHTKASRC